MDFKQLQSFVTVVECGSFTKAAEQLFVSQPTISAHIRAMEDELKAPLITRTTKSIQVTEIGKRVYDDALSILKIKEHMMQNCSAENKCIIRVASSTIPASYMLPDILPEYGRLMPQTYFSIHHCDNKGVLSGVEQGRFDLGFATMPGEDQLESIPLCRDRMVLISPVSERFLNLHGNGKLTAKELLTFPMILREKSKTGPKQSDRYLTLLGVDENEIDVVARANDQETVKSLVAGGMGVSLISQMAARNYIEEKRVLCFELPVASEKTVYLVLRKSDAQQEYIRHFACFIRKKYTPQ